MATVTLSTAGTGSWVAPGPVTQVVCWASGVGGSQTTGGAGSSCEVSSSLTFAAGTTFYYSIGAGGAGTATSGGFGAGTDTWINGTANAVPTLASQGALAKASTNRTGGSVAANIGTTAHAGGTVTLNVGGGGGAGGTTAVGGAVTSGNTGGTGGATGGGNGGNAPSGNGSQPGGGGSSGGGTGTGGNGGDGMIIITYTPVAPKFARLNVHLRR